MFRSLVIALVVAQIFGYSLKNEGKVKRAASEETTIYKNGKIYTVDRTLKDWSKEPQECMVVTGEKISFIGKLTDAAKKGYMKSGNHKVVNLKGRTVIPGLHDIHMHPLESSNAAVGTCELNIELEPEQVIDIIKKCAPNQIGTEWVLGGGHSINKLLEHINKGGRDPRLILDDALPHTPCIMVEESAHSVWVNSEALRRAGITKDSPVLPGGIVMKNLDTKEPNGILLENAGMLIMGLALQKSLEMDEISYKGLVGIMDVISSYGITSICDARVYWQRGNIETYNKACNNGKLKTRTVLDLWAYPEEDDKRQIAALKDLYNPNPNPNCFMKQSQIKFFADGLIDTTTAASLIPYDLNIHLQGLEKNIGMNYFTESRLKKYLKELQSFGNNKGFDVHVHAIGDRAVHETLNAIEATVINGTRHRITHIEMLALKDVPRFKKLNVIADFQIGGYFAMPGYYIPHLTPRIGKSRSEHNYMLLKKVFDTGAMTTLSSDWPVSPMNPFLGLAHAVDRGEESVGIKEALELYTINPAYSMRQEDVTGSLEVGKAADFVIIDRDIIMGDQSKIKDTVVHQTVLAGKTTYEKKD